MHVVIFTVGGQQLSAILIRDGSFIIAKGVLVFRKGGGGG